MALIGPPCDRPDPMRAHAVENVMQMGDDGKMRPAQILDDRPTYANRVLLPNDLEYQNDGILQEKNY